MAIPEVRLEKAGSSAKGRTFKSIRMVSDALGSKDSKTRRIK